MEGDIRSRCPTRTRKIAERISVLDTLKPKQNMLLGRGKAIVVDIELEN